MRIGICDDDVQDLESIHNICTGMPEVLKEEADILLFHNAEEMLEYQEELQLLILDIEMPGLSGIELKNILSEKRRNTVVIFVTNHDDVMKDAFGTNVYGFVTKDEIGYQLPKMIRSYVTSENNWVITKEGIDSRDIVYVKADGNYSKVYYENGKYDFICKNIGKFERELADYGFIRCERSHLINFSWVDAIENKYIRLGKVRVPLARSMKVKVKEKYLEYTMVKGRYC